MTPLNKAMILAAGRGERMRPLSDITPKALLKVAGRPLIEHQLQRLAEAGINDVVINHAWLGEQIEQALGNGRHYGLSIRYSAEGDTPLETAGGILKALPLLRTGPFLVINADIWCDFPLGELPAEPDGLAELVMVPNPPYHPEGDFALIPVPEGTADTQTPQAPSMRESDSHVSACGSENGLLHLSGEQRYTYSGIGVYRPELFSECEAAPLPLAPLLRHAISQGLVHGRLYRGTWIDIGTPDRLQQLELQLTSGA